MEPWGTMHVILVNCDEKLHNDTKKSLTKSGSSKALYQKFQPIALIVYRGQKVVAAQLHSHLMQNGLYEKFQSVFGPTQHRNCSFQKHQ